jgi:di/tricarboxylate transporter
VAWESDFVGELHFCFCVPVIVVFGGATFGGCCPVIFVVVFRGYEWMWDRATASRGGLRVALGLVLLVLPGPVTVRILRDPSKAVKADCSFQVCVRAF